MKALIFAVMLLASCAAIAPTTPPAFEEERRMPSMLYNPSLEGRRVATIFLDVAIRPAEAAVFETLMRSAVGADEIVVVIASDGGTVDALAAMGRTIIEAPAPVTCVVVQRAASAAFMVLQACPVRVMEKDAKLMVHDASLTTTPHSLYLQMKQAAELEQVNVTLSHITCLRMKFESVEKCRAHYYGRDWWMDSEEALQVGAVDRVIDDVVTEVENKRFPSMDIEGLFK